MSFLRPVFRRLSFRRSFAAAHHEALGRILAVEDLGLGVISWESSGLGVRDIGFRIWGWGFGFGA